MTAVQTNAAVRQAVCAAMFDDPVCAEQLRTVALGGISGSLDALAPAMAAAIAADPASMQTMALNILANTSGGGLYPNQLYTSTDDGLVMMNPSDPASP